MKSFKLLIILFFTQLSIFAQSNQYTNSSSSLLSQNNQLLIGGYGEVHYNQELNSHQKNNASLDVHRMVMLLGYNFSSKTQFISELEFEHVKELYVEQAFLQHKINSAIQLRAGLMLIPMGIINEYHEPTTFNGVERPLIDKYIAPSTWREIGVGVTGFILAANLKYQAYLMNGFNGYDGDATFNGKNGLRKGRQKGAESYMTQPDFAAKVEFTGIKGLNVGISGYLGKSESNLYDDGIDNNNAQLLAEADSSQVGISMLGLDFRYQNAAFQARGQFYYNSLSNTGAYNQYSSTDLGSALLGYYIEAGYNVLYTTDSDYRLTPFFRYEFLNTHHKVNNQLSPDLGLKKQILSYGFSFNMGNNTVIKTDLQSLKAANSTSFTHTINAGIGVMF